MSGCIPSSSLYATASSKPSPVISNSYESAASTLFIHRDMLAHMMITAEEYGRDFSADVMRLITIYFLRRTINIEKIKTYWSDIDPEKHRFVEMTKIYGIRSETNHFEPHPTLARIAEALPHVSLVMCDLIDSSPQINLWPWVTDLELGVPVHRHFKMIYYPGMMDLEVSGVKAQAGLLLWNLCYAKTILKTSKRRFVSIQSFFVSCHLATQLMEHNLAPKQSRQKFTEYVESLPIDARTMNLVWKCVLDDATIHCSDKVCLTPLHKRVLEAQPLDLAKWQQIINGSTSVTNGRIDPSWDGFSD